MFLIIFVEVLLFFAEVQVIFAGLNVYVEIQEPYADVVDVCDGDVGLIT